MKFYIIFVTVIYDNCIDFGESLWEIEAGFTVRLEAPRCSMDTPQLGPSPLVPWKGAPETARYKGLHRASRWTASNNISLLCF